jgi:type I restriction enzyme S subunit
MSGETPTVREALTVYATEAPGTERVPPGYKQTEVGVIPEDWDCTRLGNVATLQRGFDLPQRDRRPGTIPIVSSSGIYDKHDRSQVSGPGVVTGRYGTVGEVFLVEEDFWPLNTTLFVKDFKGNDPLFISFLLRTIDFQPHSGKSGVPGVNRNDLHALAVGIPPVAEQCAIASALSDVDALIAALDKLIAKKRAVKTAAMQQLLTGKQRLPGFSGEWEVRSLEEVADVDSDNLTADTDPDYQFNYISLEDVDRGALRSFSHERYSSAPSRARRRVRSGDVLVSTVRPNLKSHLLFSASEGNWVCSTGFSLVRCRKRLASPGFVYQHLFHGVVPKQIEALIAGSNYPAISAKDVRAFQIPMPSVEEQTAVATVLSDMDAEISALEARRDKTQQVKQGMMQELLTGRIRLKDRGDGE